MKYFYACLFASGSLLFSVIDSSAQTYAFPSPGLVQTEVYHGDWTQMFQVNNFSFAHQGDTVVGLDTFARFRFFPLFASAPWYTWSGGGKVYWQGSSPLSNPANGTLLYDFSLAVGDTFFCPNGIQIYGTYTVTVVSTIVLPNSPVRKYMELTQGARTLRWIEGIGDIDNGFFYSSDIEGGYEEFVCTRDSAGPLYSSPTSQFYCNEFDPTPNSGPNTCDQFAYNVQIVGTSCAGCDGYIAVSNLTGGTPAYTYQWSNGATTPSVNNLCQGPITLTIHDAAGDSCSRTFYIGQNSVGAVLTVTNSNPCDQYDTLCVNGTGGSAPYTYLWIPGNIYTTCYPVWISGCYTVIVTDANGCSVSQTVCVNIPQPITDNTQPVGTSCVGCCDGDVSLSFNGGTPPYTITYPNGPWPPANSFCQGWYSYCVTDSLGCNLCDSVFVIEPLGVYSVPPVSFRLFPNPSNESAVIITAAYGETMQVTDVNGKLVDRRLITATETSINTSELHNGVYLVSIGGTVQRLVVVHE